MSRTHRRPGQGARHQSQEGPVPLDGLRPLHCQWPRRRVTKLLFDDSPEAHGHGKIQGGGMVSIQADNMIGEVALAIEMGADAVDIALARRPPLL
jgi:pyruvate/2-oxoglutarate dehydrogenase complex dihydrolipoamide dehydrogenase (E3) component